MSVTSREFFFIIFIFINFFFLIFLVRHPDVVGVCHIKTERTSSQNHGCVCKTKMAFYGSP